MKIFKNIIAVILLVALLSPSLISCNPTEPPIPGTSGEQGGSDTPVPDPGESGVIGDATVPEEPKKEKPENPEKTLLQKSKEQYSSGNIGCIGITLPTEYNDGVDFDIQGYKDHDNKIFYIFLPCRADLSAVTFTASHRNGSVSGPYTADFSDDEVSENEKVIESQSTYTIKVLQSDRPTVMLQIDEKYGTIDKMLGDRSHTTYSYGAMVTTVTDEMASEMGWATRYESKDEDESKYCSMDIRGRGNATWGHPKKPFQIRTENTINLLGMEYSKKFVLLSNYRDATSMRNQLALEMGHMLGVDYTSDCRQVDLFMNGEYLGLYLIAEKIEVGVGRVEIDTAEDVLFEADNYAKKVPVFGFQTEYTHTNDRGFRIHSPEDENYVARDKARLIAAETVLFKGNEDTFREHFDLESWAKAYLIQSYMMNSDALYGSFYFYYDSEDGKLHACSPWDFDWSMGISWGSSSFKDPARYDIMSREWFKPMFRYKSFVLAILDVYYNGGGREVIKEMPFVIDRLAEENRLSSIMNGAALDVDYQIDGITNYDEAVAYLRDIAVKRIEYMENQMSGWAKLYRFEIE